METMNLLREIGTVGLLALLCFFVFLIKLTIRYWPKHYLEMEHITGSSIKYSKNYGLLETICHVIKWVFRWTKIDPLKIMAALNEASSHKNRKQYVSRQKKEGDF